MTRHHLVIGATATLALMAAGAAVVTSSISEANHPAEADLIAQRCQGFTTDDGSPEISAVQGMCWG